MTVRREIVEPHRETGARSREDSTRTRTVRQLGRVARVGDVVNPPGASISFKVEEMDKLRVARVKLIRN